MPPIVNEAVVRAWSATSGVAVRFAREVTVHPDVADRRGLLDRAPALFDPRANPCVDFGRLEERIPGVVFKPGTRDELSMTLRFLHDIKLPYRVRGTAHSSGGQALSATAVVELGALTRIVDDDPIAQRVTVEGGALWGTVTDHLARDGRRPAVLTDNLRTTIAGTLSVGGFGDASHIHGIQAANVDALTLVTPDGGVHELDHGDERFGYVLCGLGQLGVIAAATLRTHRASRMLTARGFHFADLGAFVTAALIAIENRWWDVMKARCVWHAGGVRVEAMGGRLTDEMPPMGTVDPVVLGITANVISQPQRIDLLEAMARSQAEIDDVVASVPALEFALPLSQAPAIWERLRPDIAALGLPALMPRGAAVTIAPRAPHLPLAPLADDAYSVLIALRPRVPPEQGRHLVPQLQALAARVLDEGGRIYMMSIPLRSGDVERQFASQCPKLKQLKQVVDPLELCNPGLF